MMTGTCVQLGNYRVHLSRQWRPGGDTVVWIMANPSTADAKRDDPTIQRVVKFSKRWGYGRCEVVNLHPRVSPDPKVALADGPSTLTNYNQVTIQIAMERAALVVVAWGAVGAPFWAAVTPLLRRDILRHGPRCLAKTKAGHPTHPMARGRHRIPDDAAAIPWSVFAAEWRTAGPSIGPVDAAQLAAHLATDLKAGWAGPSLDYDELLALVRQGDIDVPLASIQGAIARMTTDTGMLALGLLAGSGAAWRSAARRRTSLSTLLIDSGTYYKGGDDVV